MQFDVCLFAGRPAHTVFERESVSADGSESIVRCKPISGRTHQIRIHLQWLGECLCILYPLYVFKALLEVARNETVYSGTSNTFHPSFSGHCVVLLSFFEVPL